MRFIAAAKMKEMNLHIRKIEKITMASATPIVDQIKIEIVLFWVRHEIILIKVCLKLRIQFMYTYIKSNQIKYLLHED